MAKTLLVTGGSRGIGAAVCRLAARDGYDVAFSYAGRVDAAKAVAAAIQALGRKAVEVRRADLLLAVGTEVPVPEVVREDEDHVGRAVGNRSAGRGEPDREPEDRRGGSTEANAPHAHGENASQLKASSVRSSPQPSNGGGMMSPPAKR